MESYITLIPYFKDLLISCYITEDAVCSVNSILEHDYNLLFHELII